MRVSVGPWVRRQFRARVGLTGLEEDLAVADARILELEEERDAAQARLDDLLDRYQRLAGRLGTAEDNARRSAEMVERLMEPGPSERCGKVRLRDEAEAEVFAAQVFARTGHEVRVYPCRDCPRNPVTLQRFLHVTSAEKSLRGEKGRIQRARERGREMVAGPDGLRHYALKAALADRLDSAG